MLAECEKCAPSRRLSTTAKERDRQVYVFWVDKADCGRRGGQSEREGAVEAKCEEPVRWGDGKL
jgi:transcription elongation factor Elf1